MKYGGNRCPAGWEVELRFHCGNRVFGRLLREFLDGCFESYERIEIVMNVLRCIEIVWTCFESYERVEIVLRSLKKQVDGRIEIVLRRKGPF